MKPTYLLQLLLALGLLWPAGPGLAAPGAAVAPVEVTLTGPAGGPTHTGLTFSAAASPDQASLPLTYTWQASGQAPLVHTGGLTDTASFTWPAAGEQVVELTVSNAAGAASARHRLSLVEPPLDLVLLFDVSYSMDYDTNCYGCWQETDPAGLDYPANGAANPLPDTTAGPLCGQAPSPFEQDGYQFLVHEAELYASNEPQQGWAFAQHGPGHSFWALQRVEANTTSGQALVRAHPSNLDSQSDIRSNPQLIGMAYNAECFAGPDLSGACWQTRAAAIGQPIPPSDVPRLAYDFTPTWDGPTAIWIRAVGGLRGPYALEWNGPTPARNPAGYRTLRTYPFTLFWQVNAADIQGDAYQNLDYSTNPAYSSDPLTLPWRWTKLGTASTSNGAPATLRLYQGSAGFAVDKIIFTNDQSGQVGTVADSYASLPLTSTLRSVLSLNSATGPAATPGSATREACNPCNPVFGLAVDPAGCTCRTGPADPPPGAGQGCTQVIAPTDQLANDLFGDIAPLRNVQEAAKRLIAQLNPRFDQAALVPYNIYSSYTDRIRAKLQCLHWTADDPAGPARCYDPAADPLGYTLTQRALENQTKNNATDLGEALREGLEELGAPVPGYNEAVDSACTTTINDGHACDRGQAVARAIILTNDGPPGQNKAPCPLDFTWTGLYGRGRPYDCAMYYAGQAANQGVSLFIIGVGSGPDTDLLQAMATGTDPGTGRVYFEPECGAFYPTASLTGLDESFNQALAAARACAARRGIPFLALTKTGPARTEAGRPITYTLTVTNTGSLTATGLVITDTVPAGAGYVGGGSLANGVVSWTVPELGPGAAVQVSFVVTASRTITNSDYRVGAGGGYSAAGEVIVITISEPRRMYLPVIMKLSP